ncbi:MAG: terminase family protein [Chloroflexota bacterium]|nr:terminase family protein [Chloroflexota bacterium]
MIATNLAMALDVVRFAEAVGIEPDGWQVDVLRSNSRRLLLNCARQSGKSTTAALVGLHEALFRPESLILVISPGERQSKLLFQKMLKTYRALGHPVAAEVENKLSLELSNGSAIHALPGAESTVRGFSGVALILIDEAARVADDLYASVRPMVAVSNGRLLALSTPWGKRGWWYEAWANGGDLWERYEVPATACARIPSDFLAEEQRSMPPLFFASEYCCRFVDTDDQLYPTDLVLGAVSDDVAPLVWRNSYAF